MHFDIQPGTSYPAFGCKPLYGAISIPHKRTISLVDWELDLRAVLDHPVRPDAILCTSPLIVAIANGITNNLANAHSPEEVAGNKQLEREDMDIHA